MSEETELFRVWPGNGPMWDGAIKGAALCICLIASCRRKRLPDFAEVSGNVENDTEELADHSDGQKNEQDRHGGGADPQRIEKGVLIHPFCPMRRVFLFQFRQIRSKLFETQLLVLGANVLAIRLGCFRLVTGRSWKRWLTGFWWFFAPGLGHHLLEFLDFDQIGNDGLAIDHLPRTSVRHRNHPRQGSLEAAEGVNHDRQP